MQILALALCAGTVQAEELVDPTRPTSFAQRAVAAPRAAAATRVTAVFLSVDRRVAVFDGRVVKAGDRVGDIVIEAVLADGVRYRRGPIVEYARLPKQTTSVRRKVNSEESEP